jgi:flagellar hook-associated protein 2
MLTHESVAQDAMIQMNNGAIFTSDTNRIITEGLTINLTDNIISGSVFKIEVARDVQPVMDMIKEFVEEYNNLIQFLNDQSRTPRAKSGEYSFYEPLTEEQKREMSEKEVEQWEEKAKIGVLFRDDILMNIHSQMRSLIYARVRLEDGSSISLHQIGITTSATGGHIGILQIDEDRLRTALESNPDAVAGLFTRSASDTDPSLIARNTRHRAMGTDNSGNRARLSGIGETLSDIIDNALAFGGSIYKRAGLEGNILSANSDMARELRNHDQQIVNMLALLARREDSYYTMFSRLEQAMARSDMQMQSLMGLMSGF